LAADAFYTSASSCHISLNAMLSQSDLTLVTGATGFVGAAVARNLAAKGHRLRLMARAGSDRRNFAGIDAEVVEADLCAPESLTGAVAGCRYLFHVAADYRLWVPDPAAMRRANIDGTVALLLAAKAAGVERSVYTSSVAALGLTLDGSPADETTPVTPAHLVGAYKQSKYDAEQAVRRLAAAQDIVIVNPSTPVGPGDVKPTPTGKMVLDAARGKMPAFVDTGLNIVHVDDVAEGHVLAMQAGRTGEAYILGGDDLMLGDFFAEICRQAHRKPPTLRLPIAPLKPIAWVMERLAGITGKTPLMTSDLLKMAHKKMFFSSAKAKAELGYAPRPAASAVAGALEYFAARGLLQ
jgi:dihydroflavonol-4-reductase